MKSINALIQNIREHPEEWGLTEHTAFNAKLGIQIWICNGFLSCAIYTVGEHKTLSLNQWNLVDKWKVWRELKKLPDYRVLQVLKNN